MSLLPTLPPERIRSDVFARLPDHFRKKPIERFGVSRHSLLEGPSFDRAGHLYCTDLPFGRVFRIAPDGTFTLVTEYDGQPNGMAIHRDGRIFIADRKRGIVTLDPDTGTITTVVSDGIDEPFRGINDLTFSSQGDLYFTDQGVHGLENPSGRIFVLRANGKLELLLRNLPGPNGIVLTPGDGELYIAVTRANAVWKVRLDIFPDGPLVRLGTFVQLSGGVGPDGLAMGEDRSFVVAHFGLGGAWVFNPIGLPIALVESIAGHDTTNLAFGGPDNRDIYITESGTGTILRAPLPIAGARLFSHSDG